MTKLRPTGIWRATLTAPVLGHALLVAIVSGSLMGLLEQGGAMLAGGPLDFPKLVLAYPVLFLVALCGAYGAVAAVFRRGG